MQSLLIFFAVLSTLIIVHEWGHFVTARALGITVHRFSIGFGPVLLRRRARGTEFCVSLVPLGGYVKLAGEDPKDASGAPDEFSSRPAWQRFLVVFAGPFLNAVLAFLIFTAIYIVGHPALEPVIGKMVEGYPAAAAGLETGDRIVRLAGKPIALWEDVLEILGTAAPGPLELRVSRAGKILDYTLSPKSEDVKTLLGRRRTVGRLGIMPSGEVIYLKAGVPDAFALAAGKVVTLTGLVIASLGMLFTGQLSFQESMTGPIGIYFMTEQAARVGLIYLLYFTASLSVSLFVLNLLPIPVLDGGHLFFIAVEGLFRRPLSDRVKERSAQVGLYFLLAVAAVVIFQDMMKYGILDRLTAFFRH